MKQQQKKKKGEASREFCFYFLLVFFFFFKSLFTTDRYRMEEVVRKGAATKYLTLLFVNKKIVHVQCIQGGGVGQETAVGGAGQGKSLLVDWKGAWLRNWDYFQVFFFCLICSICI